MQNTNSKKHRLSHTPTETRCIFCGQKASPTTQVYSRRITNAQGGVRFVGICTHCLDIIGQVRAVLDSQRMGAQPAPKPEHAAQPTAQAATAPRKKLSPKAIKEILDEHVVGQDDAKRKLAVAVYNHYKRIHLRDKKKTVQKSNVLIAGPSGSGKTLLAQSLANALDIPFAVADATAMTEAGYVGEDVESILHRLIQAAGGDIKAAEYGIVYIDEIDKIGRKGENMSITRDVSGEGVQQALLKIIEGTTARVPVSGGRKHPMGACIEIDTRNILFICGGAFDGLDEIIQQRTQEKPRLGFATGTQEEGKKAGSKRLLPEDLVRFGLLPELVGRLPVLAALDSLTRDDLKRILTEPKDSLVGQYQALTELDGVKLSFDDGALSEIADTAIRQGTGARGLRTIMEQVMEDIMFGLSPDSEQTELRITKEYVERALSGNIAETA